MKSVSWDFIYRMRFILASIAVITAILCLPVAARLSVDPSNSALFEKDQVLRDHEKFEKTFGGGENIVIGLEHPELLSSSSLQWIEELTLFFEKQPEIHSVRSITRIKGFRKSLFHLEVEPIVQKFLNGEETNDYLTRRINEVREVSSPLISADNEFVITVAELSAGLDSNGRHAITARAQTWLDQHPSVTGKVYVSGTAVEQDKFVSLIQKDHDRLVPLTLVVMVIMMILVQGRIGTFVFPVTVILVTLVITRALMVFMGHAVNVVTTLVSPVILIVSVSDPIHYQTHYVNRNESGGAYLKDLFQTLGLPCFMTSLTTIAGFLSLLTLPIPAIRMFGVYSAVGTAIAYIMAAVLAPFFISLKSLRPEIHKESAQHHSMAALWIRCLKATGSFLPALSLALVAVGVAGALRVRTETDILHSFAEGEPFRVATEKIQEKTGGVYTLECLIQTPDENAYFRRENLDKLLRFKQEILRIPGVSAVLDVTDLITMIDRAVRGDKYAGVLPPEFYLNKYIEGLNQDASSELEHVRTLNFRETRMTVELDVSSADETLTVANSIKKLAVKMLPEGWAFLTAGKTYLLAEMSRGLARNQIKSVAASFSVIALMMIVSLKSVRLGLLSAYVNVIPLSLLGFVMSGSGIPLNTATATVASVAFGLIIDNAVHVLFRFQRSLKSSLAGKEMEDTLGACAIPLTVSTLTLCAGFAVTLMGGIKPTVHFGVLMITVLLLALIANLLFLPEFLQRSLLKYD